MRDPVTMMASPSSASSAFCGSCANAVDDSRARPRTAGAAATFNNVSDESFFTIQSLALEMKVNVSSSDVPRAKRHAPL